MAHRIESHDLQGKGPEPCEVYEMEPVPHNYWAAVTDVPCPVKGCEGTVVWCEAGHIPGWRTCMMPIGNGCYDMRSVKHFFLADGNVDHPTLVRDSSAGRYKGGHLQGEEETVTEAEWQGHVQRHAIAMRAVAVCKELQMCTIGRPVGREMKMLTEELFVLADKVAMHAYAQKAIAEMVRSAQGGNARGAAKR